MPVSTPLQASPTPTFAPSKGLSSGAKAGLGAGFAVVFILLLAACAYALRVRRNRKRLLAQGLENQPSRSNNTKASSLPEKHELAASERVEAGSWHKSELASPTRVEADSKSSVRRELAGDPPVYHELAGDLVPRQQGDSSKSSQR